MFFLGAHLRLMTDPAIRSGDDVIKKWGRGKAWWQWARDLLLGWGEEEAAFFLNPHLPNYYNNIIEHANRYRELVQEVTTKGTNRDSLDGIGEELEKIAAAFAKIDTIWVETPPGKRLAEFGVKMTWEHALAIRDLGRMHETLIRLEKQVGAPLPLHALVQAASGQSSKEAEIKQWLSRLDQWLKTSQDEYKCDMLHELLASMVFLSDDGQEDGFKLARLYAALKALGLKLERLQTKKQEQWVTTLKVGLEVPCTSFQLGQRQNQTTFATSSPGGEKFSYHPTNPPLFLAESLQFCRGQGPWGDLVIGISHLDPRGRFALVEDQGEPLVVEGLAEDSIKSFCCFVKELLRIGLQPKGFEPSEQLRVVGRNEFRLRLDAIETEPLDLKALEDYFFMLSLGIRGDQVAYRRRLMRETGVATHTLADQPRAFFLATSVHEMDRTRRAVVQILRATYDLGTLDPERMVLQREGICLKERAFAISVIDADFAGLLIEDIESIFKLQKRVSRRDSPRK
jgi:hypothetical protein